MEETYDIVVSGQINLRLVPRMSNLPSEVLSTVGVLYEVDALDAFVEGAVPNTGIALHKLGANVNLIASVGNDLLGKVTASMLDDMPGDMQTNITPKIGTSSAYTVLLQPSDGSIVGLQNPGVNDEFGIDDVDFSLIGKAKMFHLGHPFELATLVANNGEELGAIHQQIKTVGILTSMDMALIIGDNDVDWVKILNRTLPYIDIFVPDIRDVLCVLRRADFDNWGRDLSKHLTADYLTGLAIQLMDMGSTIVGFRLGRLGMYLHTAEANKLSYLENIGVDPATWGGQQIWLPAYLEEERTEFGAGDAAFGGLLAGLIHKQNAPQALATACGVYAYSASGRNAYENIPDWDTLQARIANNWATRPERLMGYGLAT